MIILGLSPAARIASQSLYSEPVKSDHSEKSEPPNRISAIQSR